MSPKFNLCASSNSNQESMESGDRSWIGLWHSKEVTKTIFIVLLPLSYDKEIKELGGISILLQGTSTIITLILLSAMIAKFSQDPDITPKIPFWELCNFQAS